MPAVSVLQPLNPASIENGEKEAEAPWIVRKLVGSMAGRIVMSSYETFKATGTSVICLSPWGDSSPLLLPCIRFRDLAVHMVVVATGGAAAIAAPVMGPVGDVLLSSLGDSIIVELGLHTGFELGVRAANDLLIVDPINHIIPAGDRRLYTTGTKSLTITLKYKYTTADAALGFFRSSMHADSSLFSSVKDYLAVEKGWFSPYLFASGRRPIIPRTMTPDVVFCHGPFLGGDYRIGQTLLNESATVIALCKSETVLPTPSERASRSHLHLPSTLSDTMANATSKLSRARSHSPLPSKNPPVDSTDSTLPEPAGPTAIPSPRRMVLVVLGIKPYRHFWTTSARPGESVMQYILLNGCPAVVVPVKQGSPLIAWDTLTLEHLNKIGKAPGGVESVEAKGVANVIYEYLGLCVDWKRVTVPGQKEEEAEMEGKEEEEESSDEEDGEESSDEEEGEDQDEQPDENKKEALKAAVRLLVTGAINSGDSKEVKKKLDLDRAGIVMFRIP